MAHVSSGSLRCPQEMALRLGTCGVLLPRGQPGCCPPPRPASSSAQRAVFLSQALTGARGGPSAGSLRVLLAPAASCSASGPGQLCRPLSRPRGCWPDAPRPVPSVPVTFGSSALTSVQFCSASGPDVSSSLQVKNRAISLPR